MLRICVVDDETVVRNSIIQKLTALFPNIEVFDVGFGAKALDQLYIIQPDIVLLDIRMPEINGLDMLQSLRSVYPQIHVIIISGYDDFEYARKAIQLGAHDYLLKPVDRKELKDIIMKIQAKQLKQFLKEIETYYMKTMTSLFALDELIIIPHNISFWFDERVGKQMIIGNIEQLTEQYKEKSTETILTFQITNEIEGIYVIEKSDDNNRTKDFFFSQLQHQLELKLQQDFYKGEDLQSKKRLKKNYTNEVVKLRQYILITSRNNDMEAVENNLLAWFSLVEDLNFKALKREAAYLMCILDEGLSKQDVIIIEEKLFHYWTDWVDYHHTWSELKARIYRMVVHGVAAIKSVNDNRLKDMEKVHWFQQTLNIIETSKNLNISLEMIAEQVNVHPVTLSKMFKQQMGINFVHYLTNKRMDAAKQLLIDSDKKITDIAEELGYSDYAHFRNLFKKQYQDSPSDYRKKFGFGK